DWIVETRVDASAFDRRYQQGGLILYGDDSNYLKLDILATNAAGSTLARNVEMRSEIGGIVQNPQPNAEAPANGIVYLRLAKVGSTYTGFSSPDGTTWTRITGEFSSPGLSSARVGLFALGNAAQGATSHTGLFDYFRVVADPLTVTATLAPEAPSGAQSWYSGDVSVTLATEGGSGTVYREYNLDDGGWLEYTTPVRVTTDGAHQLLYRASSDGDATAETPLSFSLDKTLPTQSATLIIGDIDPALRTVAIASADAMSGVAAVEYRINDGDWTAYTGAVAVTTDEQTVRYRTTDVAGNQSAIASLVVPAAPRDGEPVVTVIPTLSPPTADGQHGWWVSTVTVSATAASTIAGEVRVMYRIGDGDFVGMNAPVEIAMEGTMVVTVKAVDIASNESPQSVITIRRDTVRPTAIAAEVDRAITLSGMDASSGIDRIEFRREADPAGTWRTYSTPVEMGDQAGTITYRSRDAAGNTSDTGEISVEAIDPEPSTPSVVVDDPTVQVGDIWTMVGTGFDPDTLYEVWLLSSPQKMGTVTTNVQGGLTFSFQVPLTLDAGTHHVEIRTVQGQIVAASGPLQVAAADSVAARPAGRAPLATTGATGAGGALPLALALVAFGSVVVIGSRLIRRRRATEGR
uniref:OmpL47-type beta-barrel domain-containing protein n=1 Tax=Salinibacterium sp. TaxID=1915057 RepID=UPI00286CCE2B